MLILYSKSFDKDIQYLLNHSISTFPWGDEAAYTVLAISEDRLVGIGSLYHNPLHPYRDYFGIYVRPDQRKKGVGTEIFHYLYSISAVKQLQISIQSEDFVAHSFLKKCGFQIARKCYTPILKKRKSNATEILFSKERNLSFTNASADHQKAALVLQLKNYQVFHQSINPLTENIPWEQWKEIVLANLNLTYSKLFVKDDEVIAYIFCYDTKNPNEIEIGYIGGKEFQHLESYLPFYMETIKHLIASFETVSIEADDVDPYAFAVLNEYQYDSQISLNTYIL